MIDGNLFSVYTVIFQCKQCNHSRVNLECLVCHTTVFSSSTEYEFWKYQIAAIQYDYVSRIHIRKFLLSATFNTEEDNYRLSLVREPPNRKTS